MRGLNRNQSIEVSMYEEWIFDGYDLWGIHYYMLHLGGARPRNERSTPDDCDECPFGDIDVDGYKGRQAKAQEDIRPYHR